MKLLMHTCCAPCSVYCIDSLRSEGIEPTLYWFNPNIHPYTEYEARKETLIKYSQMINVELIIDENYGLDEFCKNVINNLENRCIAYCYRCRLEETVKYAKENGFDAFTSTLFVSPYQKHDELKKICEFLSKKYDIEFLYRDFRVGYREGYRKAREIGLYVQKYCGCIFSEEDRYLSENPGKMYLPQNFEFIKGPVDEIKKYENKEDFIETLSEGNFNLDELKESDLYILKRENQIITLALVKINNKNEVELKNIITKKEFRNKGFARKMIKSLTGNYKQKYKRFVVSCSGENVQFFNKMGFDKFLEEKIEGSKVRIYFMKDLIALKKLVK